MNLLIEQYLDCEQQLKFTSDEANESLLYLLYSKAFSHPAFTSIVG